jgi:tetratricopeptide (TPR) repeat protein
MGGVGKTELAIKYTRTHEADYPAGICWLNARDTNLAAEIVQFVQLRLNLEVPQKDWRGELLTLPKQVEWCWDNWQPTEGRVLVVLDDVTDLGSCRGVLPMANRFRVLMTTRLRNLDPNFVEEIPLDVLSQKEALELLTALVGKRLVGLTSPPAPLLQGEGSKSNSLSPPFPRREGGLGGLGSSDALQLCEWLGYLPLGLELVGRYLAEDPDLSLAEMLQRLKAQRLQDEAIAPCKQQLQNTLSTAQRGVRAAFELSWQELDPVAQRVAQSLSLYAPTVFVWEWVESESELLNCSKSDFNAAKKQLYKRHLIQRVEERDGGYKIHPLIREFLQAKLAASEHKDKFRQAFAAAFVEIAKKIPESPTRKDIELVKEAIPHLEEVAQNLIDALRDEDLVWPFVGLGRFYEGQGLYWLAEPWRKQCLDLSKRLLGEGHPHVAESLNDLAVLYCYQGHYREAEPLLVQALELRKRLLEENHADVAETLNNLALLYKDQGRYTEAEPLSVQALELSKRLLGEDHPDVALSLNNLATLYDDQGRYSEAEPLYLQALELSKRLLGEDHPYVAFSLNNLANLYHYQGRYSEVEPLYLEALELRKCLLGEEHPDVAESLHNLSVLYYAQGRYSEAKSLLVQALTLSERILGVNHPNTLIWRENLALFRNKRSTHNS